MFTGLIICFNSINFIKSEQKIRNKLVFFTIFVISILLILVTKPALIFSVLVYLILINLRKFGIRLGLFTILLLFVFSTDVFGLGLLSNFETLSRYQEVNLTGGSSFAFLTRIFGLGFFFSDYCTQLYPHFHG